MPDINHVGLRIGFSVPDWTPPSLPPRTSMTGDHCRLVPLNVGKHASELHRANCEDIAGRMWTYLAYGPFASREEYLAEMKKWLANDCLIRAILIAPHHRAVGLASDMRADPDARSIAVTSPAVIALNFIPQGLISRNG